MFLVSFLVVYLTSYIFKMHALEKFFLFFFNPTLRELMTKQFKALHFRKLLM